MQRRVLFFVLMILLLTGSATGVHASTDCQRWFAAYKQQLAHSQAVKRLRAAKLRARRYARMKLAGYVRPKPVARPHRRYPRRPRMTRAEALRRFNLACGILPERETDQPIIQEETPADFTSQRSFDVLPLVETAAESDNQPILASIPPPQLPLNGSSPSYPTPGAPPGFTPPVWGYPGLPGHVVSPNGPPPPVLTAVPEPESLALLLTGLIGGAGMMRRRIRASRT